MARAHGSILRSAGAPVHPVELGVPAGESAEVARTVPIPGGEVRPGVLYVVATPIGNLGDISLRALGILHEVATVYAEDTRVTGKLLARYGIKKALRSFRQSPVSSRVAVGVAEIVTALANGQALAYVSDAGTPGVSDPGSYLASCVWEAGYRVVPIPGPAAVTALQSVAGIPAVRLLSAGFLPKKKHRQRLLGQFRDSLLNGTCDAIGFYESPERLLKFLAELVEWGVDGLSVVVGRELTKLHEEILRGPVASVRETLQKRPSLKGEIALMVYLAKAAQSGNRSEVDLDGASGEE